MKFVLNKDTIKIIIVWILVFVAGLFFFSWLDDATASRRLDDCKAKGITSEYDSDFKAAVRRYWTQEYNSNWCLAKSQCYVESHLKPDAVSPVGATGLCQIMAGTYADVAKRIDLRSSGRRDPASNIDAGVYYMATMIRIWMAPRSKECRLNLAWASYNAGPGNVIKAQKLSGGRKCWVHISPYLPDVTGRKHSAETQGYVHKIWAAYRRLKGVSIDG